MPCITINIACANKGQHTLQNCFRFFSFSLSLFLFPVFRRVYCFCHLLAAVRLYFFGSSARCGMYLKAVFHSFQLPLFTPSQALSGIRFVSVSSAERIVPDCHLQVCIVSSGVPRMIGSLSLEYACSLLLLVPPASIAVHSHYATYSNEASQIQSETHSAGADTVHTEHMKEEEGEKSGNGKNSQRAKQSKNQKQK